MPEAPPVINTTLPSNAGLVALPSFACSKDQYSMSNLSFSDTGSYVPTFRDDVITQRYAINRNEYALSQLNGVNSVSVDICSNRAIFVMSTHSHHSKTFNQNHSRQWIQFDL